MFDVTPITSAKELDCGPTCLKMLLGWYGIDVPLDQLIDECGTRAVGCSGADLLRAARLHGLGEVMAFKMDADELMRQDRPAIIHWKFRHWCVFAGCDTDGRVAVCNPDRGRFRMDPGTFAALYTGVAIFNGDPVDLLPTSETNHAAGEVFEQAGNLWRAVTAIVRGEQIREGINATRLTVADILQEIESKEQ